MTTCSLGPPLGDAPVYLALRSPRMLQRYLSVLLLAGGLPALAQTVFIPDTYLRTWLNDAKPNSVDVLGNCDTAVWNAQPPDYVLCLMSTVPNGGTVDLEGIQHLKIDEISLQYGQWNSVNVVWPGYPLNNTSLDLRNVDVGLFTGAFLPFPPDLDQFLCQNCGFGAIPPFSGTTMFFLQQDFSGQVLTVPPSLTSLSMVECNLTQLPSMPNLQYLNVSDNPLGTLPSLPSGLTSLSAWSAGLTSLPTLPAGLMSLVLSDNALTSLPPLPTTLQQLRLERNQLTTLPPLPPWLQYLDVSYNPMPVLPQLGIAVRYLYVDSCGMSVINYPLPLRNLGARYNPITALPPFGPLFENGDVRDCPLLTCLPALPNSLEYLYVGGSGITCLPNLPPDLYEPALGIPAVVCNIGTSPCPLVDPLITGTTFQDVNADGVQDPWEVVRPNALVIAQPGDLLTASDMNGNYVLPADSGSFTVTGVPGLYEAVTTAPYAVTFTGIGQVDSLNHIGFQVIPGMYDLVTTVTGTNVRPGFNTEVWITVTNVGTATSNATVQLTFDPALTYVSSSIAGAVNGNVVDWTTTLIIPGGSWTVWVELYAPPSLLLGSPVVQQATVTPSQPDQTPADNTYVLNDVVVGSFDPNDKRVEPETLSLLDVSSGTRVNYTVRFQNTGTFPAERVLITDTLSTDLQWATMQVSASSHTHTWYIHNGVLHVLFENINLPDSVSDEPGSHGFVKFSFVPSSSLMVGAAVENIANIYFDFNEPVITNTATFFVNTSLGVEAASTSGIALWPVPTSDMLWVQCDATLMRVQLLDMTGRSVRDVQANAPRVLLDVRDLSPGTYRCEVFAADGRHAGASIVVVE